MDQSPQKVALLVGENGPVSEKIRGYLLALDYQVDTVHSGTAALSECRSYQCLTLLTPISDCDALELCSKIRARNREGMLFLVTKSPNREKRVLALELGADECFSTPVLLVEFRARVISLQRRLDHLRYITQPRQIQIGNITIDLDRTEVRRDKETVTLTPTEYTLIETMAVNAGKTISNSDLAYKLWGMDSDIYEDNVKYHISRLRRKVENDCANPKLITTVRGRGYRMRSPIDFGANGQ